VPSLFVRDDLRRYMTTYSAATGTDAECPLMSRRSNDCDRRVILQNLSPSHRICLEHPATTPNPPSVPLHAVQRRRRVKNCLDVRKYCLA
jgi:hypothetical protein